MSHWSRYGLRILAGGVVAGLVIVGLLWYRSSLIQQGIARNAQTAAQARATALRAETALKALCAQRHDLDQQIALTKRLLARYPHSKLIFAIPRTLIADGLKRSEDTRQNLAILDCKEAP